MLKNYLQAGIPALCIQTPEAERAQRLIVATGTDKRVLAWDCQRGITDAATGVIHEPLTNPMQTLQHLCAQRDTMLIAHNLHLFLDSPALIQTVRNSLGRLRTIGSCLVIVMPVELPVELARDIPVLDLPLPDEAELKALQAELDEAAHKKADPFSWQVAMGLTESEARTAFATSLAETGDFSEAIVGEFKDQMLRKTNLLELCVPADPADLAGYKGLKDHIRLADPHKGQRADLPRLKAMLLAGTPGTGKSLLCRCAATILGWQLIRLDLNSLLCTPAGEAGPRLREITRILKSCGPAVLWLDDIDLCLAAGCAAGGTSDAIFARFMTWTVEASAPLLVMATATDLSALPLKFQRNGYWDFVNSVGLPDRDARAGIISIMNRRYGSKLPAELAEELDGYSGAEIEQLAKNSLFYTLEWAMAPITPLSKRVEKEEWKTLRR